MQIRSAYQIKIRTEKNERNYVVYIHFDQKRSMWFVELRYTDVPYDKAVKAAFDHRHFVTAWVCEKIFLGSDLTSFTIRNSTYDRTYTAEITNDGRDIPWVIEVEDPIGNTLKTERRVDLIESINDVLYWIM